MESTCSPHKSTPFRKLPTPSEQDNDHAFFKYTSGRWLYNEDNRRKERYLVFNVNALLTAIAESLNRSSSDINDFQKIAEGGSFRVFEATFDDGQSAIARLPYPCIAPLAYGVASEVATISFLRSHDIPVPAVLGWSASSTNAVGSPYILMEKGQGRELGETWWTMDFKERHRIMRQIVNLEAKLFQLPLPAYGSLYPREFLAEQGNVKLVPMDRPGSLADQICVGPSAEHLWWRSSRDKLNVDRGPWHNPIDVLKAVGERELAWLIKHGKPRHPREIAYRDIYHDKPQDPAVQMRNLRDYLELAHLAVPGNADYTKPTLRHPDLSPANILVSDDNKITGLIDWQNTAILPLFLQSSLPMHFQNWGDEESEIFKRPELAADFDELSADEKAIAMEVYRRRQVHYLYVGHTRFSDELHFRAMTEEHLVMMNKLYVAAWRPWEENNVSLKAELIRFLQTWHEMMSLTRSKDIKAPITYAADEIQDCLALDKEQEDSDGRIQRICDSLPVTIEGWVDCEQYETARVRAAEVKAFLFDNAESEEERKEFERCWPFQDHIEID